MDVPIAAALGQSPDLEERLTSLLSSFASAFSQATRLLKLRFATTSGIPANVLLPHRLVGREAINEGFRYELEALSNDAHLELKTLLGVPVELTILSDVGSERRLCGLVTEAHQEGQEGGFAMYRLVVESGLSALRLRHNARVFVGLEVREVTRRILAEHLTGNAVLQAAFSVDDRCQGTYPVRPFWMQYNETDEAYLRRIWAREGISFVLQPAAERTGEHPQHTLVLFDEVQDLEVNDASSVRFHRADGTEEKDAITQWHGCRSLQSGALARCGWDPATASLATGQETSQAKQGEQGTALASTLEDYRHLANGDPEAVTRRRLQAKEGQAKRFQGEGSVRTFRAGTWFTLTQHPIHDQDEPKDREFLITQLELEAVNNLPKDLSGGLQGLLTVFSNGSNGAPGSPKPTPPYTNRFTCQRRGFPVLADELDPPDPGLLTAQVVGPEGDIVHTDSLGRLKVRFLFARAQDHPEAGASDTDADSAWLRQLETWGSQGFGGSFLPRVGDEVVVQFLGGDPDQPIVTGSAHNRAQGPTSFSQASSLPAERALSGLRSRMHHGAGGNELVFDDTPAQLRTRLASDHAASHLNLGYLVQPRSGGAGTPRGEGFELRSDAWGAVRAGQGLLLTTYRTTGPHLEADPFTSQLESSLELAQALSETSEQLGAAPLEANASVRQLKEAAQARQQQGSQAVPAFKTPVLGLASPDGILSATPASHILSAGDNLHMTSGEDTNIGVGRKLALAIKDSWSVFVAKSGIQLFAGKNHFDLQAQDGSIQLLADQDAKITSANGELKVLAKNTIKLTAGQCQIEVTDKDVNLYMPGPLDIKGNLSFGGAPVGTPMEFATFPRTELKDSPKLADYTLHYYYPDLDETPVRQATFKAKLANGEVRAGKLDDSGKALLYNVPKGPVDVEYQYDQDDDDDALIKQGREKVRKALAAIVEQTRQDMADEWKEWNEAGWLKRQYLLVANQGQGAAVGAWNWLSGTVESIWQLAVLLYRTDKEIRELRNLILMRQWNQLDQKIAAYRTQGEEVVEAASEVKELLILIFHDEETRKIIMDFPAKWWAAIPPDERKELETSVGTEIAVDVVIGVIIAAFSAGAGGAAYGSAKWTQRIGKMGTKVAKLLDKLEGAFKDLARLLKHRKRKRVHLKRRANAKGEIKTKWKAPVAARLARLFPLKLKPLNSFWVGEHLPSNRQWPGQVVKYLTESERGAYKLNVQGGKLYDATGKLFDTRGAESIFRGGEGRAIFVMGEDGSLYASKTHAPGEFHHSSFFGGKPVAAAGEIEVRNGVIQAISDRSGHYKPEAGFLEQAIEVIKAQDVDMTNVVKKSW